MGTLYCDTGGNAAFSGSTDSNSATISGSGATVSTTTVTLPAGTILTSVDAVAGSATQDTIYLASATNSNTKIFWISGKAGSGGATPTVTVTVAPTGIAGTSTWAIGGRFILTNASQEAALRAGDTLIFNNSPASQSASCWTFRNAGDSTSGFAKIKGKTGVRPVLTSSGAAITTVNAGVASAWVENLELKQTHASSGTALALGSATGVAYNVKISASPGVGISFTTGAGRIIACEVTGCGSDGINATSVPIIFGCYVHDNTGDGLELTFAASTNAIVLYSIFDTNAARGIYMSGAVGAGTQTFGVVVGNTVYANGNSGLEVTDQDAALTMANNIFVNNGDAAGEYNVEWVAGTIDLTSFHGWNDFYSALGGGSANLLNVTANALEITTDPAMVNPASADFSILKTSGAFATGFPGQFLGANLGYLDMGAVQVVAYKVPPMLVNSGELVG